jgi:SAM-dependent methyltransferase
VNVKAFDKRYFDKWYRTRRHKVRTRGDLARRAAAAVAVTELILERPVRRILDIGCGEGEWGTELLRIRPRARYTGIDPSDYAVGRFGARRSIRLGTFGDLATVPGLDSADLVVCADVLHYLAPGEIVRGARELGKRMSGVALLQAYVLGDELEGDLEGLTRRASSWYVRTFARAGLTALGLDFYVGSSFSGP